MTIMLDFIVFDLRDRNPSAEGTTVQAVTPSQAVEKAGLSKPFEAPRRTSPAAADVMVVRHALELTCTPPTATFFVLP